MREVARRPRRGFTLIELLMVILIIGLLASLGTRAAFQAMQRAKEGAILMEVAQLDQSLSEYKAAALTYPPCMGDILATSRQSRFFTHITRAFPRYIAHDSSGNPTPSFAGMRQQILNNFNPTGTANWYDLATMDQAESLVFWLSGFPTPRLGNTPTGNLMGSSKLLGFCAAPTAPFYELPGNALGVYTDATAKTLGGIDKRPPLFAFDEGRLVDQDGDGWLEYIPMGTTGAVMIPPYVYFDGDLYTAQTMASTAGTPPAGGSPAYLPYPSTDAVMFGPVPSAWGSAVPYANALPASGTAPLVWINPRKFQIICAGLGNNYGGPGIPPSAPVAFNSNLPKIWPAGINFDVNGLDLDNLTNFADGRKLGDGIQ